MTVHYAYKVSLSSSLQDLLLAFNFWTDLRRCVDTVAEALEADDLSEDTMRGV